MGWFSKEELNGWQYAMRYYFPDKFPGTAVQLLQEMGADNWECFSVVVIEGGKEFYFKRRCKVIRS